MMPVIILYEPGHPVAHHVGVRVRGAVDGHDHLRRGHLGEACRPPESLPSKGPVVVLDPDPPAHVARACVDGASWACVVEIEYRDDRHTPSTLTAMRA